MQACGVMRFGLQGYCLIYSAYALIFISNNNNNNNEKAQKQDLVDI